MTRTTSAPPEEGAVIKYVCGIDIGSQSCAGCICRPDKSVVVKSVTFANTREGWQVWQEKLNRLDVPPSQMLIGMEATSRDAGESLSRVRTAGLCVAFAAPRTNASLSSATGITRQDRSA